MKPDRLNAFTDGVIAIIITIMVLELRVPEAGGLEALKPVLPILGVYALSFVNVGIFWSNHHHMMQSVRKVNGAVLWANLALLFWLSLIPFVIRWIDEAAMTAWPVAAYGFNMVMAAIAYLLLEKTITAADPDSPVKEATGAKGKELVSLVLYSTGIVAAFWSPWISVAAYLSVAAMWLIPDRRFEQRL